MHILFWQQNCQRIILAIGQVEHCPAYGATILWWLVWLTNALSTLLIDLFEYLLWKRQA